MDRQDLEGVWTVLATTPPSVGLIVAPLGYEVSAGSLFAGLDADGRRHLLIPLLPGEAAATDTKGRAVRLGRIGHEGRHYLTVSCLLPDLYPVFTQFCRELAYSVETAASPARAATAAFDRWRALFSDGSGVEVLSEAVLVGLLGELLTLEALLSHGAASDLSYWTGPLNDVHDFRTPAHAIEVKTTLVREGRIVSISSVDQLQEPPGADLILRHSRLERDPGGFDLPTLVERVLVAGARRPELAQLLSSVGVNIDSPAQYTVRRYRLVETRSYDVTGPAFPRLVRGSFSNGEVPHGTLRLAYAIDLTNEPPSPLTPDAVEASLAAFAREVADGVDS